MKLSKLFALSALLLCSTIFAPTSVNAQTSAPTSKIPNEKMVVAQTSAIDINSASVEELASLPGLGIKKANAIISYRKLNGKFSQKEELVNVKGIGEKSLAKLSPLISVSKPE